MSKKLDKEIVRRLIVEALPDADVRVDQCDIVRVYWRGRMASAQSQSDLWIGVRIDLRREGLAPEFLPSPCIVDMASEETEAARRLVYWLRRVDETAIDAHKVEQGVRREPDLRP